MSVKNIEKQEFSRKMNETFPIYIANFFRNVFNLNVWKQPIWTGIPGTREKFLEEVVDIE